MHDMTFGVRLRHDEETGEFVLSVPDLDDIIARYRPEILAEHGIESLASDAILTSLQMRMELGEEIPTPLERKEIAEWVTLDPLIAMKLELYTRMREAGWSRRKLAAAMGKNEMTVRRLMDLGHRSTVDSLVEALHALGWRFKVQVGSERMHAAA